jgi:type IV pilus assembly protein PilP
MIRKLLKLNSRFYAVSALIGIAAFAAFASGCSKKDQQSVAAQPVAQPTAQQVAKAVQKPVSSSIKLTPPPQQGNQFDFSSKKDPFKPFAAVKAVNAPSQDELKKAAHDGLPIHNFDVSQFRMIGIVTGGKENQAMVVDPTGKGYVLKVGMLIGKNDGRIISISTAGIDVLEQFKDDNGRVRKENIRITLPRKQ